MPAFFALLPLFAQENQENPLTNVRSDVLQAESGTVPLLLEGVWQNRTRYVVFDTGFTRNERSVVQEVLRIFYGWYDDRAAEDERYTKDNPRDVNDATSAAPAQEIQISFHPLTEQLFTRDYGLDVVNEDGSVLYALDEPSGAWELEIHYPRHKEAYHVPVCVIGKNLYLDFVVKDSFNSASDESSESSNEMQGFFRDEGKASGILISPVVNAKELTCYYVSENAVYHIRYWRTDMEYDGVKKAQFSDEGITYEVPKHIKSAGQVFTCVNGRGTKIRNIEKSSSFSGEYTVNRIQKEYTASDENGNAERKIRRTVSIIAFGKPYLSLVEGSAKIEDIIAEDMKRKRPEREPLFPPHGLLDFDWSVFDERFKAMFDRMNP